MFEAFSNKGSPTTPINIVDHFRHLRRFRQLIYWLLCLQNKFLSVFLKRLREIEFQQACNAERTILVVSRKFGGSGEQTLENIISNIRNLDHLSSRVIHESRTGNILFGNARWLRLKIAQHRPGCLVIADPQLLGLPGVIGLISCRRLIRVLRNFDCQCRLILFDLPDPQGSLFAQYLSRRGVRTLLFCSTPEEAENLFNIVGALGPAPEAGIHAFRSEHTTWDAKSLDVHLPRPSYEPRRTFVKELETRLKERGCKITVGGQFQSQADLYKALADTKIVVVTNDLAKGSIGRFPLPPGPARHLVAYNAETIASGALLVSQDCSPYRAVFRTGHDSYTFSTVEECYRVVVQALNDSRSAEIALCGQDFLRIRHQNQKILKQWLLGL